MAMTDEEKLSFEAAKASKTWRALRVATRVSFDLLDKVEHGKNLEDVLKQRGAVHKLVNEGGEVAGSDGTEGKADDVTA